jgi:hypothetical protein
MDALYGCTKCRYARAGCGACREAPIMERPASVRWRPEAARYQTEVPSAPTFHPTAEQFADPVAYINSIRPQAEQCAPASCSPCPKLPSQHCAGRARCILPQACPSLRRCDTIWAVPVRGHCICQGNACMRSRLVACREGV